MKLQFSLATLLICMTVLAVVAAIGTAFQVHYRTLGMMTGFIYEWSGPPSASELVWRIILWGPVAIAATLGVLWAIRRLKSRRHTEPPVG
jgi:hypothetical protein